MVSRGQVWEYVAGSRQYRVLIVSNDEYNEQPGLRPWALPIDRGRTSAMPSLFVKLAATDPLPGAFVAIPDVLRIDRDALRANLGRIGGESMNAVEHGLREFLELP